MHKRLERAASRGNLATAAPVARVVDDSNPTPRRASKEGGATFLSPNPVSPRSLRVLENCTLSSAALNQAANASMQVQRPSLSPMRSRDGRTSLSPLAPSASDKANASHVPTSDSAIAPAVVELGSENAPPVRGCGVRAGFVPL